MTHDFPADHETHGHHERTDLSRAWTHDKSGPRAWEVTITELDRRASHVIHRVSRDGQVAAVTRHGLPVALIVPLKDAVTLLPPEYVLGGELGTLSEQFTKRAHERFRSALRHARLDRGRWPWRRPGADRGASPR